MKKTVAEYMLAVVFAKAVSLASCYVLQNPIDGNIYIW